MNIEKNQDYRIQRYDIAESELEIHVEKNNINEKKTLPHYVKLLPYDSNFQSRNYYPVTNYNLNIKIESLSKHTRLLRENESRGNSAFSESIQLIGRGKLVGTVVTFFNGSDDTSEYINITMTHRDHDTSDYYSLYVDAHELYLNIFISEETKTYLLMKTDENRIQCMNIFLELERMQGFYARRITGFGFQHLKYLDESYLEPESFKNGEEYIEELKNIKHEYLENSIKGEVAGYHFYDEVANFPKHIPYSSNDDKPNLVGQIKYFESHEANYKVEKAHEIHNTLREMNQYMKIIMYCIFLFTIIFIFK